MQFVKDLTLNRRLLNVVLASLVGMALCAQPGDGTARPRLVVGITVEGLSDDNLELLRGYFGDNGFNRLLNNGVVLKDVTYGPNVDATSATAMLMSGAPASVSGIPSATVYDVTSRRALPVMRAPNGNTADAYSPESMRVTTLADEVRIADGGINRVWGIAPDPQQAVILASHAGNGAFWISDVNGNWSASSYYKEVPASLSTRNFTSPLASRLDTLKWQPCMEVSRYPGIPSYRSAYPFRHVYQRKDVDRYRKFKLSAPVNSEITSVAADIITSMKLGQGDVTDMVSIACTVAPYPYSKDADSRLETMDTYLRLDKDFERLFAAIDKAGPGMDRTLVFLAGIPAPAAGKRDEERFGIPHGVFSPRKAVSLLNVYLMAVHGNGEWVAGYHDNQIHLNRALAKERGIDLMQLRRECADFMLRMSGVCRAYTIDDIVSGRTIGDSGRLRANTLPEASGDVFVTVSPGWEIEAVDASAGSNARPMVSRLGAVTYPGIILAPGVGHKVIQETTDATAIAPTVARVLRIRSPNGAEAAPLRLR